MSKTDERISKSDFISEVAKRAGVPVKVVSQVYEAIVSELLENVRRGVSVTLTGFGRFYGQEHKGHRVQFARGGSTHIEDYTVLKFSATRAVNKSLAEEPEQE